VDRPNRYPGAATVAGAVAPSPLLSYLADMAATAAPDHPLLPEGATPETLDVTRAGEQPVWLGASPLVVPAYGAAEHVAPTGSVTLRSTAALRRLAAIDALQPTERVLRLGWVIVAGAITVGERTVTVCTPLISSAVQVGGAPRGPWHVAVSRAGPPELTPLVADSEMAAQLEERAASVGEGLGPGWSLDGGSLPMARLPRLQSWIREVTAAAGLPPLRDMVQPPASPLDHRKDAGLVAYVGAMVYLTRDPFRPSLEAALRSWAARTDLPGTAFGALYAGAPGAPAALPDEEVISPLLLSPAQHDAVVRARHEAVTVISGPPGSGKSHTVAAIAADAVAYGRSVLVATRSSYAAEVVSELLARQPGPNAVRFGEVQPDDIVARATSEGTGARDIRRAGEARDETRAHQRLVEGAIAAALSQERRAEDAARWDGLVGHLGSLAPGAFEPSSDLARLEDLADRAEPPDPEAGAGWWARWRRRRAARRLVRALGAAPGTPLSDLRTALACAGDRRAKARLESTGGTVLGPAWAQLGAADAALRLAAGRLVEALGAAEERRRQGRRAIGDLGAALRAGRRQRRRLLRDIDGAGVVTALPLWVGTARDVDDLLPDTPALFDVAILDEASQIDQPSAAGVLLRARRAVVVGDPHQLRHVSFVSDEEVGRALKEHDLTRWAARLDVRRTSILDLAAGTAPVVWLDEHHRSVPHLIEFSARRFYDGRLHVATRHPANEAADVIQVERPAAGADEVETALAVVDRLAAAGRSDIAVISPFRDVADAAQAAVLARYDLDDVERLGLRVGTVHAFQGGEADHVVLVLGLAADDPAGRRRFVEDANLFNVMVTRARRSCVVVTALAAPEDPPDGLVERYLVHAERPPVPPRTGPCPSEWGEALARELHRAGVAVRTGYPVGRWVVDLCAGEGAAAVAIETAVHPDGPPAHMARHRALMAAGWRLVDGYPTQWDHDPTRAALELAGTLEPAAVDAG
jgi:hypothetical protein